MKTPQDILAEYLNGINQVLTHDPASLPDNDRNELQRQKTIFLQSIRFIEIMLSTKTNNQSSKKLKKYTHEENYTKIINLNTQIKSLQNKVQRIKIKEAQKKLIKIN